ncbi:MAG: hypothetical protein WDN49_08595 [Acetobacteraceae bacterium]
MPTPLMPIAMQWTNVTSQGTRWRFGRGAHGFLLSIDLGGGQVADVRVQPSFQNLDVPAVNTRVDYLKATILQNFSSASATYSFAARRISVAGPLSRLHSVAFVMTRAHIRDTSFRLICSGIAKGKPAIMQTTQRDAATVIPFPMHLRQTTPAAFSPADMARHLRRTSPEGARCFALAMHKDVAWANDDWGAFWADVARLV